MTAAAGRICRAVINRGSTRAIGHGRARARSLPPCWSACRRGGRRLGSGWWSSTGRWSTAGAGAGLGAEDAADAVQDVFREAAEHVGSFRRNGSGGSFTAWLATIAQNEVARSVPSAAGASEHAGWDDGAAAVGRGAAAGSRRVGLCHRQRRRGVAGGKGLELVRAEFENRTWDAFWRTAVDGRPAADVADELGMSVPAVYKARSRVLRRLRQELGGM